MRCIPALLVAAACSPVFAQLPQGLSAWFHQDVCGRQCKADGRIQVTSWVTVWRRGDLVCGVIEQSSRSKSPSGRFVGSLQRGAATVEFDDSFSKPSDRGVAHISVRQGVLRWHPQKMPEQGYLGGTLKLRRETTSRRSINDYELRPCKSFDGNVSQFFSG